MQMDIDKQINREIGVHGQQWSAMHEGFVAHLHYRICVAKAA